MSKQVTKTPKIEAAIRAATGDAEMDVSNLAVYEAKFLSTEPLKKPGFFNKARVTAGTIDDMVTYLNKEGSVPLQIMHDDRVLPVGKVFSATARDTEAGERELIGQFYVPESKTDIVSDLDTSIIDEVSVGMLNEKALCSECGFDYFGEDASFMNLMELTCDEGHQIGENGTHIRLVGLNDWAELSLVNRGAAKSAKILPRAKQSMGDETFQRLAASAAPPEARALVANFKMDDITKPTNKKPGAPEMDEKLLAKVEAQATELGTIKAELAQVAKEKEALEAKVTELSAAAAAKAETDALSDTELKTKLATAEAEVAVATEALLPHVKAALTAAGVSEADLPTTLSAMAKTVEEKGLKLHQIVGSVAQTKLSSEDEQKAAAAALRKSTFKLN